MDTLRQIEAFVAVVRAGSYVGASQRQGDSKAALSRLVLELEARLGTRLLNPSSPDLEPYVLDKHYQRKHGPAAYYGQK